MILVTQIMPGWRLSLSTSTMTRAIAWDTSNLMQVSRRLEHCRCMRCLVANGLFLHSLSPIKGIAPPISFSPSPISLSPSISPSLFHLLVILCSTVWPYFLLIFLLSHYFSTVLMFYIIPHVGDDAVGVKWVDINSDLKLFASHSEFVKKVAVLRHCDW